MTCSLPSSASLMMAGTAWSWYSTTLETQLRIKHGMTSAQTGLVFLSTALTYIITSPLVGKMCDLGWGGFKLITTGSLIITIGFLCMGPLSFLKIFSGLWVTITSMGLQGIGISFVYIGTLLTMMGELEACGLPNTDQSKGMVSSLWTVAVCLGQAVGSMGGGLAWTWVGFEVGLAVEAAIIFCSSIIISIMATTIKSCLFSGDSSILLHYSKKASKEVPMNESEKVTNRLK